MMRYKEAYVKSKDKFDTERFINEIKKELHALSDGWLKQAKECPGRNEDWAYCATVGGVLFSLSLAIGTAMDNTKNKQNNKNAGKK